MPRGRPKGSSKLNTGDAKLLHEVAHMLLRGVAATPTNALQQLLDLDDEAAIRRLQRKWKLSGEDFIREIVAGWERERRHKWRSALKAANPELATLIFEFEQSEPGKKLLQERDPFSLPIAALWELVANSSYRGSARARQVFDELWRLWSKHPLGPDRSFLETLSGLIAQEAQQLVADLVEEENQESRENDPT